MRPASAVRRRLEWSDDEEANRLITDDPLALLIGFVLDQQVTVEKAFVGPKVIRDRLGTLDAGKLAALPAGTVQRAFTELPAVHRYPSAMAARVQSLCAIIATRYGGDAAGLWVGVKSAAELRDRVLALPGFGPMKAATVVGTLGRHYGVRPTGWKGVAAPSPTLAEVVTREDRIAYQTTKRAAKRAAREAKSG